MPLFWPWTTWVSSCARSRSPSFEPGANSPRPKCTSLPTVKARAPSGVGRLRRVAAGVHAHAAQVGAERALHARLHAAAERRARAGRGCRRRAAAAACGLALDPASLHRAHARRFQPARRGAGRTPALVLGDVGSDSPPRMARSCVLTRFPPKAERSW